MFSITLILISVRSATPLLGIYVTLKRKKKTLMESKNNRKQAVSSNTAGVVFGFGTIKKNIIQVDNVLFIFFTLPTWICEEFILRQQFDFSQNVTFSYRQLFMF